VRLGDEPDLAGLRLRALVASPDGARIVRADCDGTAAQAEALGARAADRLRAQGAEEILAALAQP
jgi:hydroxymethylbilane synthase